MRKTPKERTESAFEYLTQVLVWAWIVLIVASATAGVVALIRVICGH